MTEEQDRHARQVEKDTSDSLDRIEAQVNSLHRWLHEPPITGQPTRARQLDEMLFGRRVRHAILKAVGWAGAFVATMAAAWAALASTLGDACVSFVKGLK